MLTIKHSFGYIHIFRMSPLTAWHQSTGMNQSDASLKALLEDITETLSMRPETRLCGRGANSIFTPDSLRVSWENRLETAVMSRLLLALCLCSSPQACPNETALLSFHCHSLCSDFISVLFSIALNLACYTLLWCFCRTAISVQSLRHENMCGPAVVL